MVVALRNVRAGEELTLDYAQFCNELSAGFDCHCGAANCRGFVTGTIGAGVEAREKARRLKKAARKATQTPAARRHRATPRDRDAGHRANLALEQLNLAPRQATNTQYHAAPAKFPAVQSRREGRQLCRICREAAPLLHDPGMFMAAQIEWPRFGGTKQEVEMGSRYLYAMALLISWSLSSTYSRVGTGPAGPSTYTVDFVATASFGVDMNDAGDVIGTSYPDIGCGSSCLPPLETVVWKDGADRALKCRASERHCY